MWETARANRAKQRLLHCHYVQSQVGDVNKLLSSIMFLKSLSLFKEDGKDDSDTEPVSKPNHRSVESESVLCQLCVMWCVVRWGISIWAVHCLGDESRDHTE